MVEISDKKAVGLDRERYLHGAARIAFLYALRRPLETLGADYNGKITSDVAYPDPNLYHSTTRYAEGYVVDCYLYPYLPRMREGPCSARTSTPRLSRLVQYAQLSRIGHGHHETRTPPSVLPLRLWSSTVWQLLPP